MSYIFGKKIFKRTLKAASFSVVHDKIKNDITKEHINKEPISTDQRLAISLNRLSRGDCSQTTAEIRGIVESTVCIIVREVTTAKVENLWAVFLESDFRYDRDLLYQKDKETVQ